MRDFIHEAYLDEVFEKLKNGDEAAAEKFFLFYEPFLRLLVRRQLSVALRTKFDSPDIVHSVWVEVLREFRESGCRFTNAEHLRAYLIRATRNRFIDYLRHYRKAIDQELPLESVSDEDIRLSCDAAPDARLLEHELWSQLLTLCPANHQELLVLKREGCTLAEIAKATGLHEGSIRRILYDLARRFAADQHKRTGDNTPGTV